MMVKHVFDAVDFSYRAVVMKLLERWTSLRGRTIQDCVRVYLAVVRKWPFCGAKLYMAKVIGQWYLLSLI